MDISDLNTRQVANALVIFAAALPFGVEAVAAALMAAGAESSYLRYANNGDSTRPEVWQAYGGRQNFRDVIRASLLFPHDAEAGAAWTTADSIGLFQQRPMYGYGSIKDLMDPGESTRIFIRGSQGGKGHTRYFLQAPKGLTLAQRVQWTQGSEFPTGENYAPMLAVVRQLISHFGGLPEEKDWLSMVTREEYVQVTRDMVQDLKDGDGHSGRDLAERLDHLEQSVAGVKATVNGVESTVNDLHHRVLTPGAAWDNIQDVQAKLADLISKVDALTAKPE
jgi:hypothetical protein